MFSCDNPNLIVSDEGYSVQVLGMTGLLYKEADRALRISSEVLASPHGIVVYPSSIVRWDSGQLINDERRNVIIERVKAAFAFRGVQIELIHPQ